MKFFYFILLIGILNSCNNKSSKNSENNNISSSIQSTTNEVNDNKAQKLERIEIVPEDFTKPKKTDLSTETDYYQVTVDSKHVGWRTYEINYRKGRLLSIYPNKNQTWKSATNFMSYKGARKSAGRSYLVPGYNEMSMVIKFITNGEEEIVGSYELSNGYHIRINSDTNFYMKVAANDEPNPGNRRGGYNDNIGTIDLDITID